jgi:hypothetical protein
LDCGGDCDGGRGGELHRIPSLPPPCSMSSLEAPAFLFNDRSRFEPTE